MVSIQQIVRHNFGIVVSSVGKSAAPIAVTEGPYPGDVRFQFIVDEQLALRTTRRLAERYPRVRIQTPAAAAVFEELRSSIELVMQRDPGLRVDVEYLTAAVIGVAREIGERMLARQPLDIDGAAAFAANLILRGLPAVPRVER